MIKEIYPITGSSGFIGENFVARVGEQNVERINHFELSAVVSDPEVNGIHIVDLAAYGNMSTQTEPKKIYQANVFRLLHLLETTKDMDYKSFIVTSSLSVNLPNKTFYSLSKRAGEDLARKYAQEYDKPIVVVRPASITGAGEQSAHLIPKLIHSCMTGEKMDFVPGPVHDFLDVQDFVDALLILSRQAKNHKGGVFEVGSGVEYSNLDVLKLVEKVTGRAANVHFVDSMRSYDSKHWMADNAAMTSLGWKPTKTLEQSIAEMVNHYERA